MVSPFTPYTTGNGRLKVPDWGEFGLSSYDRRDRHGVRVWLDVTQTERYPNLFNRLMRRVPKKTLPLNLLLDTILDAKRSVLSSQPVNVTRFYQRVKKGDIGICPLCGEAFASHQGSHCSACQGKGHYESPLTDKRGLPDQETADAENR